jgi:hypothetical protein
MPSRAKLLVKSALESHGLADCERLAELVVDTLDEADFLTREALNPPMPTDAEVAGGIETSLRGDLSE